MDSGEEMTSPLWLADHRMGFHVKVVRCKIRLGEVQPKAPMRDRCLRGCLSARDPMQSWEKVLDAFPAYPLELQTLRLCGCEQWRWQST